MGVGLRHLGKCHDPRSVTNAMGAAATICPSRFRCHSPRFYPFPTVMVSSWQHADILRGIIYRCSRLLFLFLWPHCFRTFSDSSPVAECN